MGVLDDSSSNSGSEASTEKKPAVAPAEPNPQEAKEDVPSKAANLTPFARHKLQQEEKQQELYSDFCEFAKDWLEPTGCVQKGMAVLYFREHFGDNKYKYTTAADDLEIEAAFEKWNLSEEGHKAQVNEYGLFVGIQINSQHESKVRQEQAVTRRKTQIKLIIADAKRSGVKPPMDVLKQAMELGVIEVPKATLDSMKLVGNQKRVSIQVPPQQPPPRHRNTASSEAIKRLSKSLGGLDLKTAEKERKSDRHKSSSNRDKDKKKKKSSSSKLHKSMGNLEYHKSSSRKSRDKESSSRDKEKDRKSKKSSKSSSRLGQSMNDLDHKSSSRKHKSSRRDKEKDRKSTSGDKEARKSSSRDKLGKSMGDLGHKSSSRKSSSRDKDKDKNNKHSDRKSSSKKDTKKDSKDKDKDKEKKSSSRRKSSRRSSVS